MPEGRSTPLKPLLILLPEVPFESCISTTKQTWAGEHPKETMVFIWKLHIPKGATAHHQWNQKLMGILKWKIHLMNICRCLYHASYCIAVGLPALNATYCEHLQHTGKLSALSQYHAYTFNLRGCPEVSIYFSDPETKKIVMVILVILGWFSLNTTQINFRSESIPGIAWLNQIVTYQDDSLLKYPRFHTQLASDVSP
jgi:hypothetical protein